MDLRYDEEKVKSTWNFINKIWNASRFVLMNLENFTDNDYNLDNLSESDKWILNKLETTIKTVRKHMDKYEFHVVGSTLYNFIWNDYCDWYIELSKVNINTNTTKSVHLKVLTSILKMLHPFMPYVTEEIYQMLPIKDESIVISSYPVYEKEYVFTTDIDKVIEIIKSIRNAKVEHNIKEYFVINKLDNKELFDNNKDILYRMLKLDDEHVIETNENMQEVEIGYAFGKLVLCSEVQALDTENLIKEKEQLEASISKREKLLANENYVSKAPKHIVDLDREKLESEKAKLANILEILAK